MDHLASKPTIARDEEWDNVKACPNRLDWYQMCQRRSSALTKHSEFSADNTYGSLPRNRIDYLQGDPELPTLMHIHGGYWQWNNKEDYICVGEAAHKAGLSFAIVEHTLAPDASMDQIVAEIYAALDSVRTHTKSCGHKNQNIVVSGHSSGGHLAAMYQGEKNVVGTVLVSGIFDLEPMRQIYVNDALQMNEQEARRNSPLFNLRGYDGFSIIAYGENELPAFHHASQDYHRFLTSNKIDAALLEIPDQNHFGVLDPLMETGGILIELLKEKLKLTD